MDGGQYVSVLSAGGFEKYLTTQAVYNMVKHIVIWILKEKNREENALKIKETLEALNGQIPGLLHLEVGFDFSKKESSGDIVLYSEFDSKESLDAYIIHPKHVVVAPLVRGSTSDRRMVDYEL
jgi:hypothetical protein